MPHFCPKRDQRIFPEVCKKLCPTQWETHLKVASNGFIICVFKNSMDKKIESRKEAS